MLNWFKAFSSLNYVLFISVMNTFFVNDIGLGFLFFFFGFFFVVVVFFFFLMRMELVFFLVFFFLEGVTGYIYIYTFSSKINFQETKPCELEEIRDYFFYVYIRLTSSLIGGFLKRKKKGATLICNLDFSIDKHFSE